MTRMSIARAILSFSSLLPLTLAFSPRPQVSTAIRSPMTTTMMKASTTTSPGTKLTSIGGLREIVDDYDVFLLDMWGVMHDGHNAYPGVIEAIQKLKAAGKTLVILSNSSKRQDNAVRMLHKLGFNAADFEKIITSGEVAYQMLQDQQRSGAQSSSVCILGSGDGDVEYCEAAGWQVVPAEEASLILARGTFTVQDGTTEIHKRQDAAAYEAAKQAVLETAARRKLPMCVSNPDKIRPDFERPPMPGQIGDVYAALLSQEAGVDDSSDLIQRIGKPFELVYDRALTSTTSSIDRSRVIMVGDALETDITGGNRADIDSLWVLQDGIHAPDLPEDLSLETGAQQILDSFQAGSETNYAEGRTVVPTKIMAHFVW